MTSCEAPRYLEPHFQHTFARKDQNSSWQSSLETEILVPIIFYTNSIFLKGTQDHGFTTCNIDSSVQDCGNSSADPLELLLSCSKP